MATPILDVASLPDVPRPGTAYRLLPETDLPPGFYEARTSRHLGWLSSEEQSLIRDLVIGIGGVGGMGGSMVEMFMRLGVGEIRIADPEVFDLSNLNRQYGATRTTIGRSKALETARRARTTLADSTLLVYPDGITPETAEEFLRGCDLCFAEIEVFALHPYVAFHQAARRLGIPIFDGLVVGFGTNAFFFPPDGTPVEHLLGWEAESEAEALQAVAALQADLRADPGPHARRAIIGRVLDLFVPNLPTYFPDKTDRARVLDRLLEGQASILALTPPLAASVIAIRAILTHLTLHGHARNPEILPPAPSFLSVDAARPAASQVHIRTAVDRQLWWKEP